MSTCSKKIPIIDITQGDDSNALGRKNIIKLNTSLDLTGYTATFQVGDFIQTWDDITEKELELVINHDESAKLPIGTLQGGLIVVDPNGLIATVCRGITVRVSPKVVGIDNNEFGTCGC